MKRLLPLIIILCLGFTQRAEANGSCGNNLSWTLSENGILFIEGSGEMTNWDRPEDVPWHDQRSDINSVYITNGVTTIGSLAFYDCRNIHSVTMPKTLQQIGDGAFIWCTSIYTFTIPASVQSISSSAFMWCYRLMDISVASANANYCSVNGVLFNKAKSILIKYPENHSGNTYTIPNTVETIGDHAFEHTCNLTSVTIPLTVSSIGDGAFQASSISTVTIPSTVTQISDAAFNRCRNLTSINVARLNTKYSSTAGVLYDKAQHTLIQYPIGSTATSYTIPDGVTSVSDYAFRTSANLSTVVLSASMTAFNDKTSCWGTNINAYKIGDANGTLDINILDVLATLSIMKGQSDNFNIKAADANCDGAVNILDVLKILEIMKQR